MMGHPLSLPTVIKSRSCPTENCLNNLTSSNCCAIMLLGVFFSKSLPLFKLLKIKLVGLVLGQKPAADACDNKDFCLVYKHTDKHSLVDFGERNCQCY